MSLCHHWIPELQAILQQQGCVLVTLQPILGSAPREAGSRMVVTGNAQRGSIGGGNLEYQALAMARALLAEGENGAFRQQKFGLGPELNQCCGGAVSLLFEYLPQGEPGWLTRLATALATNQPGVLVTRIDADGVQHQAAGPANPDSGLPAEVQQKIDEFLAQDRQQWSEFEHSGKAYSLERIQDQRAHLLLFGAGHVGQEVAQRIRGLPFRLCWIDQRPNIFPPGAEEFACLVSSDPVAAVQGAEPGSIFVVMTHSHQLDEDICHAVLQRGDSSWLGLIGSATKRKRFVHRLKQRGISEQQLEGLVCPIGLAGIHGKQPATIALSLLAQLMTLRS